MPVKWTSNEIKQKEIIAALNPLWKAKNETGRKFRCNTVQIFKWVMFQELFEANTTLSSRAMPEITQNVQDTPSPPYERALEF